MSWQRNGIQKKLLPVLAARDGFVCHWCGIVTEKVPSGLTKLEPQHATIDHVIPRSRGGSSELDNLVMACFACNQRRGRESGSPGLISEAQLLALLSGNEP